MTAKGLQKCVAHCSSAALQVRRGEDLLTADSPGIKYQPTLKCWPRQAGAGTRTLTN